MRVLVCGGRDYDDRARVYTVLDEVNPEWVIHGNARGADTLAADWARSRNRRVIACPANWARDGKRAGPIRNQNMLGQQPDLVIAFPGGRGTADMVQRARKAGIDVREIRLENTASPPQSGPIQAVGKGKED